MRIIMVYVVRPSECDYLAKHVACYVYEFINDVNYELSHFGIRFGSVQPLAKIYFECPVTSHFFHKIN